MTSRRPRIGIVGGGVNGIGTATALLRTFPYLDVTVYSEVFSPYTTGDGAAGLWTPYLTSGTSADRIVKWSEATWKLFDSWYREGSPGVILAPLQSVDRSEVAPLIGSHIVFDYRKLTQEELKPFGPEYTSGHTYSSYIAEASVFIPNLMAEVSTLGGNFERRNLRHLEDLEHKADIIINCSGIGSRDLVPDPKVYPIRGQIMKVRAPWVRRCTIDNSEEGFAYIIPNSTSVVLGGTHQDNDWRTTVDLHDSATIWANCTRLEPELKNAEIIREWVGLRPARKGGVRLEEDVINTKTKKIPVVHNYGHGGSGVTTFWGCALDVKDITGKILHRYYGPSKSRL